MTEQPDAGDEVLTRALRDGDERAFADLVRAEQGPMVRIAQLYVPTRAVAEEVVQETWLGVLNGLDRFEGRSSLRTWIYRILVNIAKTRGARERRSVPLSSLIDPGGDEPSLPEELFQPAGAESPGHWRSFPARWDGVPEERLVAGETAALVRETIDALPAGQQTVITLRDVQGWSSAEVCNALEITETNQRVLLHRARAKVRNALDAYLVQEDAVR